MKKLSVLLSAAIMMVAVACQPEPVELSGDSQQYSYQMTDAELDQLLESAFGHQEFSLQEKMDFLSDYYVSQISTASAINKDNLAGREPDEFEPTDPIGPGPIYPATPDEIVCVAQVYDADFGTYFTQVDAGTVNDYLGARVKRQREGSFGFVGTNANVYRNGVNIKGAIDSESNFRCSGADVKAVADCDWSNYSQQAFAYVYITCDD